MLAKLRGKDSAVLRRYVIGTYISTVIKRGVRRAGIARLHWSCFPTTAPISDDEVSG